MDVFVIPVGADKYELYYEQQEEPTEPDDEPASTGMVARWQRRFNLDEVQHYRLVGPEQAPCGNAKQQRITDLTGCTGDGDANGCLHTSDESRRSAESAARKFGRKMSGACLR